MTIKPKKIKNSISPILRAIVLATAGLLGFGLSACDNADGIAESNSRMEESIRTSQENSSDAWITTKVKTELLADNLSKGFDIEVKTVEGVVSLDGKVKDIASVMHVQQIASEVKGVVEVDTTGLMKEEMKSY